MKYFLILRDKNLDTISVQQALDFNDALNKKDALSQSGKYGEVIVATSSSLEALYETYPEYTPVK